MNTTMYILYETLNVSQTLVTSLVVSTDASVIEMTKQLNRNGTRVQMSSLDIAYVTVTLLVSIMSILGCFVILIVHWLCPDLRTSGRNMLVHLTIADLLTAIGNVFGVTWYLTLESLDYTMVYCYFHSALTIMSSIASFLWTVVIAWFVFRILISMQFSFSKRQKGYTILLPIVCWGVPAVIALSAVGLNVLGYDHNLSQASWCWINPENEHALMWMFISGKAWELGTCISTFCLYGAVKILLFQQAKKRSTLTSRTDRRTEKANIKLTFVPIVFLVIRIWGTIRFLIGCYAHEFASSSAADWITILQGAGDSAQGFANFVMYIFTTKKIRHRIFYFCSGTNRDLVATGNSQYKRSCKAELGQHEHGVHCIAKSFDE
ncbi:G-protein coupled receptor 157 [Biomphalaria pfeifferi]|uniref:G-protein coupled receptor 157 n=1 Tax=Biomphalaria pfeifferi TaxID=112525 RepID=A0AAD8BNU2_BIOPF|nr:G-protein coupled receptor 157 [Biomphalaria pfeifferi]